MNLVETILTENIDKPHVLFVFPTDVAVSRWVDHLLRLRGGGTVAMHKFTAWDTFKKDSIRAKVQKKQSIPSALRKMFVASLIQENAQLCRDGKTPLFSSLIRVEWAQQAASFAEWFAGLLPQLGAWFSKTTGLPIDKVASEEAQRFVRESAAGFDSDDRDLYALCGCYAQFLEAHGLFEPAWEKPPFDDDGKECFIFFPESITDFNEYRELLADSGHVQCIGAPESEANAKECDVAFYSNSRSEIAEAALYMINLHNRENVPWESIVVSIPDTENYEPYVLRELVNRNIPYVRKSGKPLTSYPAGRFFQEAAACASSDFSFSAFTALLLNNHLPWKDSEEIQKLVDFGINNNCVSSWTEEQGGKELPVNVWEDAFKQPYRGIDTSAKQFFGDLKRRLKLFRNAASFAEIRNQYFAFRERFLDMENCLPETDLILSRCIAELMQLTEIEKNFPGVHVPDPFLFLIEYLGEVNYLAQQNAAGVVILPYRTAAPAPFDCHIVIGASQPALSIVFPRLDFLPRHKREKLGLTDEDASAAFIALHKVNSFKRAAFFCAEHSFSGYVIPHSRLNAEAKPRLRYAEDAAYQHKLSKDLFRAESDTIDQCFDNVDNAVLHEVQKHGFDEWFSRRKQAGDSNRWKVDETLLELIRKRFCNAPNGKYSVSASSLTPYYHCSLRWLFERVLAVENIDINADLMMENIAGLVYHAALNLFFTELKQNDTPLSPPDFADNAPVLPAVYRGLLDRSINAVFDAFPCLPGGERPLMSMLTARLIAAEKDQFYFHLERCLANFLLWFAGCKIIGSETNYQAEKDFWFYNGTVDCMLQAPSDADKSGKAKGIIVDFKLNNMPPQKECNGTADGGLINFQLPMYLNLAEENEQIEIHTALFFSIIKAEPQVLFGEIYNQQTGKRLPNKDSNLILRDSDRFISIMNEFAQKAEQFAHEIKSGQFTVFQSEFENCLACEYHRICRTVYHIARTANGTWSNDGS